MGNPEEVAEATVDLDNTGGNSHNGQKRTVAVANDKGHALHEAFWRNHLPNVMNFIASAVIFGVVIFNFSMALSEHHDIRNKGFVYYHPPVPYAAPFAPRAESPTNRCARLRATAPHAHPDLAPAPATRKLMRRPPPIRVSANTVQVVALRTRTSSRSTTSTHTPPPASTASDYHLHHQAVFGTIETWASIWHPSTWHPSVVTVHEAFTMHAFGDPKAQTYLKLTSPAHQPGSLLLTAPLDSAHVAAAQHRARAPSCPGHPLTTPMEQDVLAAEAALSSVCDDLARQRADAARCAAAQAEVRRATGSLSRCRSAVQHEEGNTYYRH
ncbi:hypothetical protein B0H17DRAFT_1149465 [Mycena rosella]|uniref:Uncharacterized protein n=1 Tax=Mycena rosella TaxID=1033263 RepID=A0AAD7C2S5_MYCRO|nr:hypothetical protein B0H17DRAFT_1149465 [Mycena rosella]